MFSLLTNTVQHILGSWQYHKELPLHIVESSYNGQYPIGYDQSPYFPFVTSDIKLDWHFTKNGMCLKFVAHVEYMGQTYTTGLRTIKIRDLYPNLQPGYRWRDVNWKELTESAKLDAQPILLSQIMEDII